jgi:hypothetical protein
VVWGLSLQLSVNGRNPRKQALRRPLPVDPQKNDKNPIRLKFNKGTRTPGMDQRPRMTATLAVEPVKAALGFPQDALAINPVSG